VLSLQKADPALFDLVDLVVTELLARSTLLGPDEVMVVGARCRDILQSALGHELALRATTDIDLGLAVANWDAYDEIDVVVLSYQDKNTLRFSFRDDDFPFGSNIHQITLPRNLVQPEHFEITEVEGFLIAIRRPAL
jgi:predicted nucleotidyltransferase